MGVYMPFDVQDEIVDIRERLARIETRIDALLDREAEPKHTGSVVLPVAAVVAGLEVMRALVERFT